MPGKSTIASTFTPGQSAPTSVWDDCVRPAEAASVFTPCPQPSDVASSFVEQFAPESEEFLRDSYTGVSGTLLSAHVGELGASWAVVDGNHARLSGAGSIYHGSTGATVLRASGISPSLDHEVEAQAQMRSAMIGVNDGMDLFIREGARKFALFFSNLAGQWQLYRDLGTPVMVASTTASIPTTGYWPRMKLRGVGRQITVYADDVLIPALSFTDDADSAIGRVCVRLFNVNTPSTNNSKLHWGGPIVGRTVVA